MHSSAIIKNQAEVKILTDLELIQEVKEGNQNAFTELMKLYKDIVAYTVKGMLGGGDSAEDIVQEVFIRFYKSIDNFRGESSLKTYLTRIAINLSLNEIRRQKLSRFIRLDEFDENKMRDQNNAHTQMELKEIIKSSLQKLSPKHRSVLVLRLIDGYSTEETAQILNIPLGTVLSRLARAQKKMKKFLGPILEI